MKTSQTIVKKHKNLRSIFNYKKTAVVFYDSLMNF